MSHITSVAFIQILISNSASAWVLPDIVLHLQNVVICRNFMECLYPQCISVNRGFFFFVLLINQHLSNWEAQRMSEIICSHKMLIEYL